MRGYLAFDVDKRVLHRLLLAKAQIPDSVRKGLRDMGFYLQLYHVSYKATRWGELEYWHYGKYLYRFAGKSGERKREYIKKAHASGLIPDFPLPIEGFAFACFRNTVRPVFIRKAVFESFKQLLTDIGVVVQSRWGS